MLWGARGELIVDLQATKTPTSHTHRRLDYSKLMRSRCFGFQILFLEAKSMAASMEAADDYHPHPAASGTGGEPLF